MQTTSWPTDTRRSPGRRRVIAGVALGAAVVVSGVVVASQLPVSRPGLTDAQLTSWTSTPTALAATSSAGSAALQWCTKGAGLHAAVSDLDRRGTTASMLVASNDQLSFCIASADGTGMSEIVQQGGTPWPDLAANAIDLGSEDQHGTPSIDSAWGRVGSDVRSVVLHAGSKTIVATVGDGRWTAWWPSSVVPGTLTAEITTTAGAMRTVTL